MRWSEPPPPYPPTTPSSTHSKTNINICMTFKYSASKKQYHRLFIFKVSRILTSVYKNILDVTIMQENICRHAPPATTGCLPRFGVAFAMCRATNSFTIRTHLSKGKRCAYSDARRRRYSNFTFTPLVAATFTARSI